MTDRPIIQVLRLEAVTLAAAYFEEYPDIGRLWSLAAFFEQFLLHGADGTRDEYAPATVAPLRVVPK